jgi:PKD repeat protein
VNAAAGDYRLQAGSPAIDAGDPATLAAGESSTDLHGNPRANAGRKGDAAVGDVGAYEFQPHAPTVTARASLGSARTGTRITFSATGADSSPGDAISYRWSFDDGAGATGASVVHAFAKPGRHTGTVTATDVDGFTATGTQTVTVTAPKPRLTGLKLKPRSFKRGHATTIGYRDTAAATTTLTIERRKGRRWLKVLALKHHDRAGPNKVKLKSKRLKAGAYRVVAVARDAGGTSHGASAEFTVKR